LIARHCSLGCESAGRLNFVKDREATAFGGAGKAGVLDKIQTVPATMRSRESNGEMCPTQPSGMPQTRS
jgi:hypothetical protein